MSLWPDCGRLVVKSCPTLLQPHGLYPTWFLCPWDFPGKNTGVGCHFLFQGIFLIQGLNRHLLYCRQILHGLATGEASWPDSSLLFSTEYYPIAWTYDIVFIHTPIEGHIGCFQVFTNVSKAVISICVHVFVWIQVFNSFG